MKKKNDPSCTQDPHPTSYVQINQEVTLHLRVKELARLINVLDGLLADTVTLLFPGHRWHGEDAVAGAGKTTAVAAAMAGLLVLWALRKGLVEQAGNVFKDLAKGKMRGDILEDLVRSAEVGKLVIVGSGLGLVALDANVEVGYFLGSELALDANNLVGEVLLEVRLDVLGGKGLKLARGNLALQAGGQGECARGHDGLGRVGATSHHTAENTVRTNVAGVLGVVGRRVVGSLSVVAVRRGSSAVRRASRGSRVRNWVRSA